MKKILVAVTVLFLLSSSTVLAQDFCKGDFDYNGAVDAEDVTTFLTHFGRNQYNDPCPPDGPAPVAKTGQTTCYDSSGTEIDCEGTGQDGEYQKGIEWPDPRYRDNEDGTVTDNLTGLIWMRNANCFGLRLWSQALSDCNGLASGHCGLTDGSNAGDWRLPDVRELRSVVDFGEYGPALPSGHPFQGVVPGNYWSSTTGLQDPWGAWCVSMYSGSSSNLDKNFDRWLWAVKGGH